LEKSEIFSLGKIGKFFPWKNQEFFLEKLGNVFPCTFSPENVFFPSKKTDFVTLVFHQIILHFLFNLKVKIE